MEVIIPGVPVPKLRPRFSRHGTYDTQKEIKQWYRAIFLTEYRRILNSDDKVDIMESANISRSSAFEVAMYFYMPIPKNYSKKRSKSAIEGKEYHTKKPDIDNLAKFVLDCANGILFPDDKQIISITAIKKYAEKPYTALQIRGIK